MWFLVAFSALVHVAQAVPFRALPAAASFELAIMNGLPDNFTVAAACRGGPLSRSRWFWRAGDRRFRLDCLQPQPDPEQQCPWMYSAAENIWHYNGNPGLARTAEETAFLCFHLFLSPGSEFVPRFFSHAASQLRRGAGGRRPQR